MTTNTMPNTKAEVVAQFIKEADGLMKLKPFMAAGWVIQMPNSLMLPKGVEQVAVEDAPQAHALAVRCHDGTGATAQAVEVGGGDSTASCATCWTSP